MLHPHYPKLRTDLVVSHQESAAGPVMVVKDPASGDFFRLRELERFIVERCDGETPAETIRMAAEAHFDASLAPDTFRGFLDTLRAAGLLETGRPVRTRRTGWRGRFGGSLLYLRFRLFNPDRGFAWAVARFGFVFSPAFGALMGGTIALALFLTFGHWTEIGADFARVFSTTRVILPLMLIVFLLASAHECGHGMMCKHFGGEVPEVGVMLMYLQPALYCNVSDAWLFPEKSRRLWVGLAGPLFELFLWSLATLVWWISERGTWMNDVAYMVMTASGIKTLINFNPLIKLDGYYLLSDYLDVPNLRRRAFAHIGAALKRLAVGASASDGHSTLAPARERRIVMAYGLIAFVFSLGVLAAGVAKLGRFLAQHDQPMGFVLLAGLLGLKVRRRIRRLFPSHGRPAGDDDDDDDDDAVVVKPEPAAVSAYAARPEPPAHEVSEPTPAAPGVNEPAGPRPHDGARAWGARRLVPVLLAAGLVLLALIGRWDLKIRGPLLVLPVHNADVRAEVDGTVTELRVHEGDRVVRGELIARLSGRDLEAAFAKTSADIAQAEARLALLEHGPEPEELAVATAELSKAEQHDRHVRERLAMDRAVFDSLVLSRRDLIATEEEAAAAAADLAEARNKREMLRNGPRPEELATIRAEIRGLASQRDYLAEQIRHLEVKSPVDGIVATPAADLHDLKDRLVHRGDLMVKVFDYRTLTAEIPVSEHDIADVRVGGPVLVKARAYPDRTFRGVVTAIATASEGLPAIDDAAAAARTPVRIVTESPGSFLVTTSIENPLLLLKPGMTGEAKIVGGKRSAWDLFRRWLSHAVKLQFWSWS